MNIEQKEEGDKGSFNVIVNHEILATMSYVRAGDDKIIIDHTEVSPLLKGQGAGKQLLEKVVGYARENKIKIIPLCQFAKSVFEKVPDWGDVL